jgi:hypothetical protein
MNPTPSSVSTVSKSDPRHVTSRAWGAGALLVLLAIADELDNPVGAEAAQLGRHGQHDPRPSDPEHRIECGDLAEEIGRDLADLVASLGACLGLCSRRRRGEGQSVRTAPR